MKRSALIMLVVMAMIVMFGCSGGQDTTAVEEVKEVEAGIEVVLNSTDTTKEDKWDELQEGHELVLVDITIKNNTDAKYEFNPNYIQLEVDGNKIYVSDKAPKNKEVLNSMTIDPGESINGIVAFDIEEGKEYKVTYDDFDIQIELN